MEEDKVVFCPECGQQITKEDTECENTKTGDDGLIFHVKCKLIVK